jgi:hypothetical protein
METESTLSPEQVEECRAMFRDSCEVLADNYAIGCDHLAAVWELCPILRVDFEQTVRAIMAEGERRYYAGRR